MGRSLAAAAVAVLTWGEVGLSARAKSYALEVRNLRTQLQQKRRFPETLQALEELAAKYKDPDQVKEIGLMRIECRIGMGQYAEAAAEAAGLRAAHAQDKALGAQAMMFEADAQRGARNFDQAIAAYRKLAADYGEDADRAVGALLHAGDIYCKDLKKYPEGLALYAEVETKFAADPVRAAQGAQRAAVIHETITKDLAKAAAAYVSLAEKYAAAANEPGISAYYNKAADCLVAAGKGDEAMALAARAEKAMQTPRLKTAFTLRQAELLTEMGKHAEARARCAEIICEAPLDEDLCQQAQTRVVDSYRLQSKFEEALAAAKVLYCAAASDRGIREAAGAVLAAFRSADGHLGRGNEFMVYQRFGPDGPDGKPGTEDDVKVNHLAAIKPMPEEPGRDRLFAAAVAAQPDSYDGYRTRGFLHAYWGKPNEAAKNFHLAFKIASGRQLAAAATELVIVGMKGKTCSFFDLQRVFEYISYGPAGKSGKEKIPDPFKDL